MDAVRQDMAEVEVTEEDAEGWTEYRWKSAVHSDPWWEKPEEDEDEYLLINMYPVALSMQV